MDTLCLPTLLTPQPQEPTRNPIQLTAPRINEHHGKTEPAQPRFYASQHRETGRTVSQLRDRNPRGDGTLKKAIDFDQLRQELSTSVVEGPQERYQLNWPGKREALLTANAPIAKTLRPCREESVDFDSTQNLFIEGDNLDALKLLQETYLGKVKMIYIDPPYNTGNDFIYEDDFAEDTELFATIQPERRCRQPLGC